MNITDVKTYVNNVKCTSDKLKDIMTVEHRRNNPKRDFLFVNRWQGKHIPTEPCKVETLTEELGKAVYMSDKLLKDKPILVVGFCETATLLGQAVADYINQQGCKVYYMQTTREQIECEKLFGFEEEHSHAVDEALYISDKIQVKFNEFGTVVLVDDEISTGKTMLNFNDNLKDIIPDANIVVASVCNWQSLENQERFKRSGISHVEIFSGQLRDPNIKLNCTQSIDRIHDTRDQILSKEINTLEYQLKKYNENMFKLTRCGNWIDGKYRDKESMTITKVIETLMNEVKSGEDIDIIGTEEFMYIPYKVAKILETLGYSHNITVHATTRSPIDVIDESVSENQDNIKYGIREAFEINSPYELGRKQFIYNLRQSKTIVITDSNNRDACEKFLDDMGRALTKCGCEQFIFLMM